MEGQLFKSTNRNVFFVLSVQCPVITPSIISMINNRNNASLPGPLIIQITWPILESTLYADQEALRIVKLVNDRCTQGFKNDKTSKQAKRFAEHDHS